MSVWILYINDNVFVSSTKKECIECIRQMEIHAEVELTEAKGKSRYWLSDNEYLIEKKDDYWDGA